MRGIEYKVREWKREKEWKKKSINPKNSRCFPGGASGRAHLPKQET